jgi:hypothetical protein
MIHPLRAQPCKPAAAHCVVSRVMFGGTTNSGGRAATSLEFHVGRIT